MESLRIGRQCRGCEKYLPDTDFHRAKNLRLNPSGRVHICRKCIKGNKEQPSFTKTQGEFKISFD